MSVINRNTTQASDGQVIVGIKKDLQNVSTLPLNAETYTPTSLAAFFQSRIDAANAVATARANWLAAARTYEAINTKGVVVVHDLKQYVMNVYGKTSPVLADFGFAPPKTATQTPEQKAASVAKRAATRKARNTLGKKAKLAIKGTVAPSAPAILAPPAQVAPPPAPAPVAAAVVKS